MLRISIMANIASLLYCRLVPVAQSLQQSVDSIYYSSSSVKPKSCE